MNNSTIHGFKYLVDKEKSFIEKVWWICILTLSSYTCAVLIKSTWRKWEENPVFIALRQKPVSLWDIPFPAVTVCYGYLHNKQSIATFLSNESENTSDPCNAFSDYQTKFPSFKEPNASEFFEKTAFSMDDIFSECFIANYGIDFPTPCSELFSPIFTDAGLCFSSNMLSRNDIFENVAYLPSTHLEHRKTVNWTVDDNYSGINIHVYPERLITTTNYIWMDLKSFYITLLKFLPLQDVLFISKTMEVTRLGSN
ncbi:pickpocket protein 28-like [Zophobas morio]|uniref:pickpocket protein 28-like n=1 Tax=Zophobas morio TaxID=2755281 RepID=UPI0030834CED